MKKSEYIVKVIRHVHVLKRTKSRGQGNYLIGEKTDVSLGEGSHYQALVYLEIIWIEDILVADLEKC